MQRESDTLYHRQTLSAIVYFVKVQFFARPKKSIQVVRWPMTNPTDADAMIKITATNAEMPFAIPLLFETI